ncbi:hypothetical protein ACFFGH_10855 [Lysobacter korlensis]|uniref:Uncharacterized protein n=1 Tax=Lysobacter korlensis TaxID=553636 RepID=A0ABV6RQX2_9GAMM
MTTYQDPPPLSRRAARQSERAQAEARETAERSAEEHVLRPASGRRALTPEPNAPAEPLTYVTQSRPNLPTYAGRARSLTPVDAGDAMPPTQALAKQDHPSYRSRDYSPEARPSSAFSAPQPRTGTDLDYFTQGGPGQLTMERPQVKTEAAPAPAQLPVAPGAAATDPVPNATLTRRELRALRAAAQSKIQAAQTPEQPPATEAVDFLLRSGPIDLPRPARATSSTPVSALDALSAHGVALTADAVAAATSGGSATPPPLVEPEPAQKYPSFTDLIGIQRSARAEKDRAAESASKAEAAADVADQQGIESFFDDTNTPTAVAPVVPQSPAPSVRAKKPAEKPEPPVADREPLRSGSAFPHWSQSEVEDDAFPSGMSRGFASGSTGSTPASLVLPSVPNPSELSYSLSTGEILVTGSIDLPRSLGATGAHPDTLDDAIDHLLDADDEEMKTTGSTPVRAIRAVSSHTSTRGMIAARKPKSNRLPTVLAISASAMAAVVLTLGIVSVATGSL